MNVNIIHDITRLLSPSVVVYPGDDIPEFTRNDHGAYVTTSIRMSSHSGTHIDVPSHFIPGGGSTEQVPLTNLIGLCRVLDLSGKEGEISAAELLGMAKGIRRILLKTSFSGETRFRPDYRALSPSAAKFILHAGVICAGTDAPSIEAFDRSGEVHTLLLGSGCSVIELLDLSGVQAGNYVLVALPLRLAGLDGAPARAVLLETGEKLPKWPEREPEPEEEESG